MPLAYAIDFDASEIRVFASTTDANAIIGDDERFDIVASKDNLSEVSASLTKFAATYSEYAPQVSQNPVKKFESKEIAINRFWMLLGLLGEIAALQETAPAPVAVAEEASPEKPAKAARKSKAEAAEKSAGTGKRGRGHLRAATYLYPSAETAKENPRREGSFGYTSLEIIRSQPGIAYEDFILAGGRSKDLDWDVKFGNAFAEPEPRKPE